VVRVVYAKLINVKMNIRLIVTCFICISLVSSVHAQRLAERNAEKRAAIDAKRAGTDPISKEALPASREFIRTDSTYYVGWMFEGIYKSEYAADYLGYKNAITPLKKALDLLERDYARELRVRTADFAVYYPVFQFHVDYGMIAYQLMDCYANIDRPDLVYELLRRALKWNFQREFVFQAYNYLAWTTHRNRFYTSEKYSFLKNSIAENEALAHSYLDSAMARIKRNQSLNAFFSSNYVEQDKQSVYHYRAMLYGYALQMDSAAKYYQLMRRASFYSHNNYATFLTINGQFREAEREYRMAANQDGGQKALREFAYYTSILQIYKAKPDIAVQSMRDMIRAVGSTPGFGWYNIALARALSYQGDIGESERYLTKAEGFKELHIGTTLGQSHYDFSVNLVKLMNSTNRLQSLKFEHKNWWYNPSVLASLTKQSAERYLMQYLIVNQFASNPERDMVVYKLFSTESTVSWDEIWFLIRDFTNKYFVERFENEVKSGDKRKLIAKYFKLFTAKLKMQKGKFDEANQILQSIAQNAVIDEGYERLFVARLYEALAQCADERGEKNAYYDYLLKFYRAFPQLFPFSDVKPAIRLNVRGAADQELMNRLKDCNIEWITSSSIAAAEAVLSFGTEGNKRTVTYYVIDNRGAEIVQRETLTYTKSSEAGLHLAYRLFGISQRPPLQAESPSKTSGK
jgi:Tfp pilus assembly protein PilF